MNPAKLRWIRDTGAELVTTDGFVAGRKYHARVNLDSREAVAVHHKFLASNALRGTITYQASGISDVSDSFLVTTPAATANWVEQPTLTGESPDGVENGVMDPLYDLGGAQLRITFDCTADGSMQSFVQFKE